MTRTSTIMTKALATGTSDEASALMSVRSERSLLKSRRTRNVRISRRMEMPGRLLRSKLASETAPVKRKGVRVGPHPTVVKRKTVGLLVKSARLLRQNLALCGGAGRKGGDEGG